MLHEPTGQTSLDFGSLVRQTPDLAAALGVIVDRREQRGRLPRSITLPAAPAVCEALRRLFTPRAVTPATAGRVRIDLAAFVRDSGYAEERLEAMLYAALGRKPRDPAAEARALRSEIERGLTDLQALARADGSRAFVAAELRSLSRPESAIVDRANQDGTTRVLALAGDVVRCIDALAEVQGPVRVQNFAARVLGSSKALRPGSDLFQWLGGALVDHDRPTRRALDEQGVPPHRSTEIARALEVNGVYHDEAAASVLCYGPLVYEKRGERFDHVERHFRLGESSRLILQQLRDATFERPAVRRVTVFENLTPYLDYVDACVAQARHDEVVLCSGGQASWAVIAVLGELARFGLPVRHSGDLDRTGVSILRSLKRRSGARVEPLCMDADTHVRYAERGQPLSSAELERLKRLVGRDAPSELCHDLLRAILSSRIWIEQEQFADELLARALS